MRWFLAVLGAIALSSGACTDVGSCPGKDSITPGGACSGDMLQCEYDLASPSPACDGTNTTIATSCVCTSGSWGCPSAVSCPAAGDDSGAVEGGSDASGSDARVGDASGGDASVGDARGGDASGSDSPGPAPTDAADASDANGQ